ncbi:MAG: DUF2155 domain-containing protein [Proteobacteria bacterium]|nr:DUF2155 domain-containing protein [Pseudomonadota bacterium]
MASCLWPLAPHAERQFDNYDIAVLQGLDKMNARVQRLEIPVGKELKFGPLSITAQTCRKTPPEETPETAAYLEIRDTRFHDPSVQTLFKGWMFASSPALSALEHPNYDVWVLDCKNPETKERSPSKPSSSPKKASPSKAAPKEE